MTTIRPTAQTLFDGAAVLGDFAILSWVRKRIIFVCDGEPMGNIGLADLKDAARQPQPVNYAEFATFAQTLEEILCRLVFNQPAET
jgi:hypothetical protein